MMQFFQGSQARKVWDPIRNRVVVTFENGQFQTEDPALIELLTKAGYRYDGRMPEKPAPEPEAKKPPVKSKPKMVRRKK